ncbi:MAG: N-acetyltransferase [Sphingomonadaceae bacterium]|nr:N-acetyltransferase [Sphingomonadaceae bacterium]
MLTIRPATDGDAQAIADIYAHHVRHGTASFDTDPPPADSMRGKIAAIPVFFVAEIEGTVAAYAYAAQFRDRPAYATTCENSIYVHPDRLGQGIGSVLLGALMEASIAAGFRQMLAVIGDAAPASVALHARAGFVETGRMRSVGRKFGRWRDTLYMQRALGEGDSTPPHAEP